MTSLTYVDAYIDFLRLLLIACTPFSFRSSTAWSSCNTDVRPVRQFLGYLPYNLNWTAQDGCYPSFIGMKFDALWTHYAISTVMCGHLLTRGYYLPLKVDQCHSNFEAVPVVDLDGLIFSYIIFDHQPIDVLPDIVSDSSINLQRLMLCHVTQYDPRR
jgi:hypothetical protein